MTPPHLNPRAKHDAVLVFDAIDSNPNGDPDNAGRPRTDLDTQQGIVSDASLKRKVRDSVQYMVEEGILPAERNGIFIRRGVSLNAQLEQAYEVLGLPKEKKNKSGEPAAAEYMTDQYFDVRMFGAVMSTGDASAGKVTGPVTIGLGRSFDPVLPMEMGITRTASTKEEAKENASQMGTKVVIPYGLYSAQVHYQPTRRNQVTEADLNVLWSTLGNMFEITRSAARPDLNVRGLFVFSHENPLGNAPARRLLESVVVRRTHPGDLQAPTSFADYIIDEPSDVPAGVTYVRLV